MNKIYKHSFQSFLFLGTFLLTAVSVQAQQVSAVPGGPFNQADSWVNDVPTQSSSPLTISVNSEITKDDSFSWGSKVTVNGVFDVNGSFSVGYGGTEVNGALIVLNDFQVGGRLVFGNVSRVKVGGLFTGSGGVDFGDEAVVEIGGDFEGKGGVGFGKSSQIKVGGSFIGSGGVAFGDEAVIEIGSSFNGSGGVSFGSKTIVNIPGAFVSTGGLNIGDESSFVVGGDFSIGGGSNANIRGDLVINGALIGDGSSFVIHKGAIVTVSRVDANMAIEVREGGTLIVEGGYKNGQKLTIREGGLVEVRGGEGYNSSGELTNYGVMTVAADYVNNSGGNGLSVLDSGVLDIGGDLVANKRVKVDPNAVLLVRGSVYYEGEQSGMFIDGTMVVAEDFRVLNGYISTTGKVVVGGALTVNINGGFSSPDQHGTGEANLYLLKDEADHYYRDYDNANSDQSDNKSGDFSDFEEHEGNSVLWDWVESVLPDVVNPGQSNPVYKWVGALNSDWYNRVNWNGRLPGYGVKVLIRAGRFMPVIKFEDGLIELKDLTIDADANLTLNPGGKLTVKGDLSVADEGALIMKNTTEVNGLASLIVEGAITGAARAKGKKGEVTIELEFPYDEWYYVSQPIKDAKSDIYGVWNEEDGSFNTNVGWVNVHRANRWYRIGGGVDIAQLEGVSNKYRPEDGNNHVVSYVGRLNNEAIARSYSNRQYYLFGNPYPSSINWQDDKGWERNNIGATLWYRTRVNGNMTFVTYNRNADPGARAAIYPDGGGFDEEAQLALIPPLQSAWMASLGNSSVSITKEAQLHTPEGAFLKSSSTATSNVVRITAENATSRDGAVLYFSANATEDIDKGDSEKMFNEPVEIPEVYTRVGSKAVAINGLPELKENVRTIPLSVRNRMKGEVSLNFDMSLYSGEHDVYFEDKETGAFMNVNRTPSYTYSVGSVGDNHERFALHFYKVVTGIESPSAEEEDAGSAIQIRNVGNKVMVSASMELVQERPGRIEVYTIEGHKVSELSAQSSRTLIFLPKESGVYIVRAAFGQLVKSERVLGGMSQD